MSGLKERIFHVIKMLNEEIIELTNIEEVEKQLFQIN